MQGCFLLFSPDAGPHDAGPHDAGPNDAGSDAGCAMMCMGVCTDLSTDPERCGSCDRACSAPDNGTATCTDAVCGFECDPGFARVIGACVEREVPRPIAPLSTATVTLRRPTLRWELAARSDGARIELYHGGPSGLSATAALILRGPAGAGDFGFSVASAGDINGDGFADVIVGAYRERLHDGAAHVHHGGPSGLGATAALVLRGPAGAGGQFGFSVASAEDINGDGFADVVVGAFADGGAAYVYHGGPSGLSATAALVLRAGSWLGFSGASAGDVNGDGFADVITGTYGENSDDGAAYVYHGGPSGLGATAALVLRGPAGAQGPFGWSVASAGDINGDGFSDVVIGATREPTSGCSMERRTSITAARAA